MLKVNSTLPTRTAFSAYCDTREIVSEHVRSHRTSDKLALVSFLCLNGRLFPYRCAPLQPSAARR